MLDPAEVHTDVAIALVQNGRIDEAIEHFQKSLEINPDNAPIHYALGMALASRARTDEAIAHFEEALRLDPSLKEAHSDLGIALDRKGQKDEALEHFRKAVAIAPITLTACGISARPCWTASCTARRRTVFARRWRFSPAVRSCATIWAWS